MTDVVAIDVVAIRAAGQSLQAGTGGAGPLAWRVGQCQFGNGLDDPARARAIREGYLRLARAIGVFATGSASIARGLAETVDAYERGDTGNAVALEAL